MKTKVPTVTIGIPAYNEEANIGKLLEKLLQQKEEKYILEKIIVRSDGSTDQTVQIVRSFADNRILLLTGKRLGLALNENEIIEKAKSDYLLLLNADVLPKDSEFINDIIVNALKNNLDHGGIKIKPITPTTLIETLLQFSVDYKERVFENLHEGDNWYTCKGSARLFSRKYYSIFKFKDSYNEDTYSYLTCKKLKLNYSYLKNTYVVYQLPKTLKDHLKQGTRYLVSVKGLDRDFDKKFLKTNYAWPVKIFLIEGVKGLITRPTLALGYLMLFIFTKIISLFISENVTQFWQPPITTRKLPT